MAEEITSFKGHGLRLELANDMVAITELPGMIGTAPYHLECITGIFKLLDESGLYDGNGMAVKRFYSEDREHVTAVLENSVSRLTCSFSYRDGVWSRKDLLKNLQDRPSVIRGCLARFTLLGDSFRLYAQEGAWCSENQGKWLDLSGGSVTLANMGIRTTEGAFPFACIRDTEQGRGLAFHVLPIGSWVMKFNKYYSGPMPVIAAELGLSDDGLALTLEPGEEIALPEILFYPVEEGDNGLGSSRIHRYLLQSRTFRKEMPVLYNTWFHDFERIDPEALKLRAKAAAELGCEYFVIDAGWFGVGDVWFFEAGDWQERQTAAFCGKMGEFADFVRSLGMKFGIWMEPERAYKGTRAQTEHPELFLYSDGGSYLYDLSKPAARQILYDHIKRLTETYGLEFMKLDFNMAVGYDPSGSSFYRYYQGYYELMDRLMADFPQVFFEACASGGLRTDISTACACDCHFLTDTVNPTEILRILEGGLLRLPPRVFSKWYVARQMQDISRWYHARNGEKDSHLLACADGCWGRVVDVGEDFMETLFAMGPMGFSAKPDLFSPDLTERMKKTVAFFKEQRDFLARSVCHLLTAPKALSDHKAYSCMQLKSLDEDRSLIFTFRLEDPKQSFKFFPRDLDPRARYSVSYVGNYTLPRYEQDYEADGETILEDGITLNFPLPYAGRIVEVRRLPE